MEATFYSTGKDAHAKHSNDQQHRQSNNICCI